MSAGAEPRETRWARQRELGSPRSLRFAIALLRRLPRRLTRALVRLVAAFYCARGGPAVAASRAWLSRVAATEAGRRALGRPVDAAAVRHHFYEFAIALYDRILVWSGALDALELEHDGSNRAFALAESGRGALLVGAHLGSVELLWLVARSYRLPVNVVAYFGNAATVNAFLDSLDPERHVRVIDVDPSSVQAAFTIRSCIDRGEWVVILADRLTPGRSGRTAEIPFLGTPAPFPLAPFQLAATLGCPLVMTLCVSTGDLRYRTVMRPISEGVRVPRAQRDAAALELLERYAALLEEWCLAHPYQWFNFYDFWEREGAE